MPQPIKPGASQTADRYEVINQLGTERPAGRDLLALHFTIASRTVVSTPLSRPFARYRLICTIPSRWHTNTETIKKAVCPAGSSGCIQWQTGRQAAEGAGFRADDN